MSKEKEGRWITVNGRHVFLGDGETVEDALKNNDWNIKDKQIKHNQSERDYMNSKNTGGDVDTKQFNKDIAEAKESRPIEDKWRVDVHTVEEYDDKGCKCWTSKGGSTVAVTSEGDIISVCKHKSDRTIRGADLLSNAVRMGGTKLDSFAGNHKFYTDCGFEPVSWTPFNTEYAPDGWKESGCDKEPVVFYRYVGIGKVKYTDIDKFYADTKPFTGDDGYDNAYAFRDSKIKK